MVACMETDSILGASAMMAILTSSTDTEISHAPVPQRPTVEAEAAGAVTTGINDLEARSARIRLGCTKLWPSLTRQKSLQFLRAPQIIGASARAISPFHVRLFCWMGRMHLQPLEQIGKCRYSLSIVRHDNRNLIEVGRRRA
jgi:hypothetical protein